MAEASEIDIEELDACGMIDLRLRLPEGDAGEKCLSALETALGVSLPMIPRRASETQQGRQLLWMSPDQWLLLLPKDEVQAVLGSIEEVRESLGVNLMTTDMSDARAVFRLRGDGVRELLMKAIAVDFLAPNFSVGELRRCSFAGIAAMVTMRGESPDEFDLYVFRSYGSFVLQWLRRAAMPAAAVKLFR